MSSSIDELASEIAGAPGDKIAERPKTQESPVPGIPSTTAPPTLPGQPQLKPLTKEEIYRPAIGALLTTLGAAFMVGGMFTGLVTPRLFAAIGGAVGVAAAVWVARATRRESLVQVLSLLLILLAGLVALGGSAGFGAVTSLGDTLGEAFGNARLRRPPAPFDIGWRALLPWAMGLVGYTAAYIGTVGRKPAAGLLVPVPVVAFAAIAQPPEAQVPAGIVAFVAFVLGLAVIYRADRGEGEGVSTAYEMKRAARTAPLVVVLIVALFGLSQTGFLFPESLYDPTQTAQLPRPIPLDAVRDRVLFETQGDFTGPWRTGILAVYDGEAWRLPPFSESNFQPLPDSGLLGEIFNNPHPPEVRATVTIKGMDGVVLPVPARLHGVRAINAPELVADPMAETIRVDVGQIDDGLNYEPIFALLPTPGQLQQAGTLVDQALLAEWTDTAGREAPPAVRALLAEAPIDNLWDRLDFMRETLLDTVTATGQGLPVPVPPSKVEDMLAGTREATPYEIVAAQALIARWAGVPARIGYGFDQGNEVGSIREYRPVHGSAWLEVYFQGHGWFPITGLPKQAKQSLGRDDQQLQVDVVPSDDIGVELFIPTRLTPPRLFFKVIQRIVLLILPFVVTFGLVWLLWPMVYKARRTSRRRQWALQEGRAARVAVAYTEFRDLATDLGVGDPYATPLQYLEKVVDDDEHAELAWLVTRCLWGDLQGKITDDEVFAAEELGRSLRRRIFEAQPFTIRGIAFVSRLSLRDPYAPELLSPPVAKVDLGAVLARLVARVPRALSLRRRKPERLHIPAADEGGGSR